MIAFEEISTPRLCLQQATPGRLSALINGPAEYERVFFQRVADGYIEYPDVLVFSLRKAQDDAAERSWWLPFLMIHKADEALVGACGFNGPPDAAGVVEIGYGIAPSYRQLGLTSEAAEALVQRALGSPKVTAIRALTSPEPSASTRILTKCGFVQKGVIEDAVEGLLWEWWRNRFYKNY